MAKPFLVESYQTMYAAACGAVLSDYTTGVNHEKHCPQCLRWRELNKPHRFADCDPADEEERSE